MKKKEISSINLYNLLVCSDVEEKEASLEIDSLAAQYLAYFSQVETSQLTLYIPTVLTVPSKLTIISIISGLQ